MKCHIFESRSYIFLFAFVLTLKMDAITSFDDLAKRNFLNEFLAAFVNPKPNYNTLNSPFAIRDALLASDFVAKGETKSELETLLYGEKPENFLRKLTDLKYDNDWNVRLFVNQETEVSICVKNVTSDFIEYVDYDKKIGAKKINAWVSERSKNLIPELRKASFKKKKSFVTLVHVQYFDALWEKPFENIIPAKTEVEGKLLYKPMLQQDNEFLYGSLADLNAEAVVLPLKNNAKVLVLKPFDEDYRENFEDLKKRLKGVDIREIPSRLTATKLSLYFPILETVKCIRDVTSTAQNLNISNPFQRKADFRKLHCCSAESYIESINQHSRINSNLTYIQVASETDVRFSFVDDVSTAPISAQDDDDAEEELLAPEFSARIVVEPNENLQKLVLRRFLYVIIKDDAPLFVGTIVKFHNIEKAKF